MGGDKLVIAMTAPSFCDPLGGGARSLGQTFRNSVPPWDHFQLPYHPGHEELVEHLLDISFTGVKLPQSARADASVSSAPETASDLYAEVIGVIAQARFVRTVSRHVCPLSFGVRLSKRRDANPWILSRSAGARLLSHYAVNDLHSSVAVWRQDDLLLILSVVLPPLI